MDLTSRLGQVWVLNDGETVELVVDSKEPVDRITEVRWVTLILWCKDPQPGDPYTGVHPVGSFDHLGESAFANAESGDDENYSAWWRIT